MYCIMSLIGINYTTYKLSNYTFCRSDQRLFIVFIIYIAGFATATKYTQETDCLMCGH